MATNVGIPNHITSVRQNVFTLRATERRPGGSNILHGVFAVPIETWYV